MRLPQPPKRTFPQTVARAVADVVEALEADRAVHLYRWTAFGSSVDLCDALTTRWPQWRVGELATLPPEALDAVHRFFEEADRWRTWMQHTEAMPATFEGRYDAAVARLRPLADAAITALGGAPDPTPPPGFPSWWGRAWPDAV
ncbi:MAG: hypothetical protein RLZZ383_588 [Pseudomonadota bacterium]|jgi:hypothetical protein